MGRKQISSKEKAQITIGIDIDGVILDFERIMRYYAEIYSFKLHHRQIKNSFNYLENYKWTKKEKEHFISDYLIKGTLECQLVPGAKESIDYLHQQSYQIVIITARGSINKKTKEVVNDVLKKNEIYYDQIIYEVTDKVKACQNEKIDIMIDDNPFICENLYKNKIKTIYFKDNDTVLPNSKYLTTVSNWGEIIRYIATKIK